MTLEYKANKILCVEQQAHNQPLIGYINPYGKIIDLSILKGPIGHDNWRNPVTSTFLQFLSFVVVNTNSKDLKIFDKERYQNNSYPGIEEIVKRGVEGSREFNFNSYDSFVETLERRFIYESEKNKDFIDFNVHKLHKEFYDRDEYEKLVYDLINFYKKAYSNNDFFNSTGIMPKALKKNDFLKLYDKVYKTCFKGFEEEFYNEYLMIQLMPYLKDICVQYLGYHSIERAIPNKDLILFNNINEPSNGYTFARNPKSILTSEPNVNEVFYNWLLMDWEIKRLPRFYWYDKEKRFELESPIMTYHQTDEEEILSKEIQAIKRRVPKEERYKYFR